MSRMVQLDVHKGLIKQLYGSSLRRREGVYTKLNGIDGVGPQELQSTQ